LGFLLHSWKSDFFCLFIRSRDSKIKTAIDKYE
jgi:hypothetical protein